MPLKQQNEECQNLLTRYVEPLAAAGPLPARDPWPGGLFDTAWKELLRNHPHDSICGCSTDAVHQDMDTRFAAVRQTGEQYPVPPAEPPDPDVRARRKTTTAPP